MVSRGVAGFKTRGRKGSFIILIFQDSVATLSSRPLSEELKTAQRRPMTGWQGDCISRRYD